MLGFIYSSPWQTKFSMVMSFKFLPDFEQEHSEYGDNESARGYQLKNVHILMFFAY